MTSRPTTATAAATTITASSIAATTTSTVTTTTTMAPTTAASTTAAPTTTTTVWVPTSFTDDVAIGVLLTDADVEWTAGNGDVPQRPGDDYYEQPPAASDLCPGASRRALAPQGSLFNLLDTDHHWVFIGEWVAPAAGYDSGVAALERCVGTHTVDGTTVTVERLWWTPTAAVEAVAAYTDHVVGQVAVAQPREVNVVPV